jgi:EpsI family protein
MTTKRLLILQIALLAGFSSIFLLPKVAATAPQGVRLELPDFLGEWYGTPAEISERERLILADDTDFARKVYANGFGDEIFVSIVLSGQDLHNSIHRPELCLPAQGWSIASSSKTVVPLRDNERLRTTRLYNVRNVQIGTAETAKVYSLNYYWFIGAENITPSHFERTYIDIRDRLLKGRDQRWAYVTVASTITENITRFGRDEKATDQMLQSFIAELFPRISTL